MKRALFLIFASFLLCSCHDSLDKSVFEPLELKQLNAEIKKDSLFALFYEHIQAINSNTLDTESKRAKYADLTYRRVYNLYSFHDTILYKRLCDEWNNKYKGYSIKADSVINYWKRYKEENLLDQYVKIEIANIATDYYSIGEVSKVRVGFRFTPLKGPVEQLRFYFSIEPKIDQDKKCSTYSSIFDKSRCLLTEPFSKPIVRYFNAEYELEKKIAGNTVETLLRDYNVNIAIDKIRIKGENLSADNIKVPSLIEKYLNYGKDFMIDNIIKDYIDSSYVSKLEYTANGISDMLKEKDALSLEYFSLPTEKEDKD